VNDRAPFGPHVLELDCELEVARISDWMANTVKTDMRRRGVVVAVSGGVDSAVCLGLGVRAFGAERVHALLLPERDSASTSTRRGREVCERFGVTPHVFDIAPVLEALGCYRDRDAAIRAVVPGYEDGWKSKIVIAGGANGGINFFRLVVQSPDGALTEARLPLREYLQIVAATNHKQRVRKNVEYFHADRLNHAVVGTPNRLEYDQGFFVKNGDGAADLKPIAHLYKTQVYALARHLGVPESIRTARPSTDTYSLEQGQDEFYFALPYDGMDLALWAVEHGVPIDELARALDVSQERARHVCEDIRSKRRTTRHLHASPALIDPVGRDLS
jgi:NAD+ synthase